MNKNTAGHLWHEDLRNEPGMAVGDRIGIGIGIALNPQRSENPDGHWSLEESKVTSWRNQKIVGE
ncbi:MAG: hypothetical protein WD934_08020 [Gemmatimonadales bacterium]